MSYTVGSLFAGIGGICLGFKQANYKILWANEIDQKACETYAFNFPDHKLYCEDIHSLKDPKKLGKVDIITSGFPCQAFSVAGYRKGFHDPRGNLFFETARFIKEIQPKAFLLEKIREMNVKTLGVYRLVMKVGSDNYRESAVLFLIDALQDSDFELIIYEPKMDQDSYKGIPLLKNLEDFISRSDMIVANRLSDELSPVHHKIFSRDLFTRDI